MAWLCRSRKRCAAILIYVSGEIMWRRRRDDSQGRPFADSSAT
jgi:hypothetical protein